MPFPIKKKTAAPVVKGAKKKPATQGPKPAWQGVADKMLGSKC